MGACTSSEATADTPNTPPAQDAAPAPSQDADTKPSYGKSYKETYTVRSTKTKDEDEGRVKNIFAKPLEMLGDFKAPVHEKTEEQAKFIKEALGDNFVFADLSKQEIKILVDAFEEFEVPAETAIIEQGDVGDFFYVIASGKVDFLVSGTNVGKGVVGGSFGELALLYNCPRAATCKAINDCKLWRVDQQTFRKILASYQINAENEVLDVLAKVDIFKGLTPSQMRKIADTLMLRSFKSGEVIFKKGDEGNMFYVVKEGTVVNTEIEVGETKYSDQLQEEGDFFGERSLTTGETRAANAIAKTDCVLLCMSRDDFIKNMGPLEELVRKSQYKYQLKGVECIAQLSLSDKDIDVLASLFVEKRIKPDRTIFEKGKTSRAAIFFVVSGAVQRDSGTGDIKTLGQGEYFGEENFAAGKPVVINKYSYKTLEPTIFEVLGLDAAKIVLKSVNSSVKAESALDPEISLARLKKHRILGAGTFGQVWLATDKKTKSVYALKIQSKRVVVSHEQYDGVVREKNIMAQITHPFVIKMVNAFQDDTFLYMVLEMYQGGELFSVIHKGSDKGLPTKSGIFYAACILEGLDYMHQRKILYRDLKPENVLLGSDGYCVIVDLGFAKIVSDKTFTLCGTPLYIAPEVLLQRGHDKGADIWSLGILIFELVTGYTPFYQKGIDQGTLFKNISRCRYKLPSKLPTHVTDIVSGILVRQSSKRLGCRAGGAEDLRNHPWFDNIDFDDLVAKSIKAPWIPQIKDAMDCSNFNDWSYLEKDFKYEKPLPAGQQKYFADF